MTDEQRKQKRRAAEQRHGEKVLFEMRMKRRVADILPTVELPEDDTMVSDHESAPIRRAARQRKPPREKQTSLRSFRLPAGLTRQGEAVGITVDAHGRRHYAIDGESVSYMTWYRHYARRVETPCAKTPRVKTSELLTTEQREALETARRERIREKRLMRERKRLARETPEQRERRLTRQRGYYHANPDEHREYVQRYYQEHREEHREYYQRYYQEHREELREYYQRYYQEHREELRAKRQRERTIKESEA